MTLSELLQSIADAIRTKTKGTDKINAQDFPTAIANISGGSGNAYREQVLAGRTFTGSNYSGEQTGTMPNNGTVTAKILAGKTYTIPKGYHSGSGYVTAADVSVNINVLSTTSSRVNTYVPSGYTFIGLFYGGIYFGSDSSYTFEIQGTNDQSTYTKIDSLTVKKGSTYDDSLWRDKGYKYYSISKPTSNSYCCGFIGVIYAENS